MNSNPGIQEREKNHFKIPISHQTLIFKQMAVQGRGQNEEILRCKESQVITSLAPLKKLFICVFIYLFGYAGSQFQLAEYLWPRTLQLMGSKVAMACGLLTPQPGIEPTSPALQGGFLITGPAGKSLEPFSGNHRKTYFNRMRRWELRRRKDLGSREQRERDQ